MDHPKIEGLRVPLDGGGCAAKIEPSVLRKLLSYFPASGDPRVLTNLHAFDDAVVYQIDEERHVALNVDFIAPVVSDPYNFGQIAVANALSDLYSRGASPLIALNILAYPPDSISPETVEAVLRGGLQKAHEAGVPILGGHSISSNRLFYGLACLGMARTADLILHHGANPGDRLILTKPLGTGAITTGCAEPGIEKPSAPLLRSAIECMANLNASASLAMRRATASAATDVTGFGLVGHLSELLQPRSLSAVLWAAQIPLIEGIQDYLGPAGPAYRYPFCSVQRNIAAYKDRVSFDPAVPDWLRMLLFDSQTSGGLLIAIAPAKTDKLMAELAAEGVTWASIIGEVKDRAGQPGPVIAVG